MTPLAIRRKFGLQVYGSFGPSQDGKARDFQRTGSRSKFVSRGISSAKCKVKLSKT